MGDPSTSPGRPTTLMRLVLALITAATTLCTAGPVILIVGTILGIALFAGAAYTLAHTGALDQASFEAEHGYGLAGLVVFVLAALAYRVARRGATGLLGAVSRRPLIAATIGLPLLSLLVVSADWNRGRFPELSGALILDDLYFFSLGAVVLMVTLAALLARGVYRWAAAERYRAGLITGAQVTLLALLLTAGRLAVASLPSAPPPPANNASLYGWESARGIEAERRALVELDARIEHRAIAAAPAPSADDDIRACIQELIGERQQVQRTVGSQFQLSEQDAYDIVQDALLNVCNAHVRRQYTRLGAVLQRAAQRRAMKWSRRRARMCELDDVGLPFCHPAADEGIRFDQEDSLLDAALCAEDENTQRIIRLRIAEELPFAQVGAHVGLPEDTVRYQFNNALRRMRKRVTDACDL